MQLLHYGGPLAAPVFRDIATKLYAMYVEKKNSSFYAAIKDSTDYFYAGYTSDIKNVYNTLNVTYTDSALQNNWSHVYADNYEPVVKANSVQQAGNAECKRYGIKRCVVLAGKYGIESNTERERKSNGSIFSSRDSSIRKGLTVYLQLS